MTHRHHLTTIVQCRTPLAPTRRTRLRSCTCCVNPACIVPLATREPSSYGQRTWPAYSPGRAVLRLARSPRCSRRSSSHDIQGSSLRSKQATMSAHPACERARDAPAKVQAARAHPIAATSAASDGSATAAVSPDTALELHPPLEPYDTGMLDVDPEVGHRIYYEQVRNSGCCARDLFTSCLRVP